MWTKSQYFIDKAYFPSRYLYIAFDNFSYIFSSFSDLNENKSIETSSYSWVDTVFRFIQFIHLYSFELCSYRTCPHALPSQTAEGQPGKSLLQKHTETVV